MNEMTYLYITIAVVLIIAIILIGRAYLKNKKPTQKVIKKSGIDVSSLVKYLGNKENIVSVESSMSKVNVVVKDNKVVEFEAIKQLGATGIVLNESKITMIFGKVSEALAIELKQQ